MSVIVNSARIMCDCGLAPVQTLTFQVPVTEKLYFVQCPYRGLGLEMLAQDWWSHLHCISMKQVMWLWVTYCIAPHVCLIMNLDVSQQNLNFQFVIYSLALPSSYSICSVFDIWPVVALRLIYPSPTVCVLFLNSHPTFTPKPNCWSSWCCSGFIRLFSTQPLCFPPPFVSRSLFVPEEWTVFYHPPL